MSNLLDDELITLAEAATFMREKFPKSSKLHVSSLYRWAKKGVNGRKLEAVTAGNKIFTSVAAVERFMLLPPMAKPTVLTPQEALDPQVEIKRNPEVVSAALRRKLATK